MLTAKYTKRLASVIKWLIPMVLAMVLLFSTGGCGKPDAAKPADTTAAFELVEGTTAVMEEVVSSEAQRPGEVQAGPEQSKPSQIQESEELPETTEALTEGAGQNETAAESPADTEPEEETAGIAGQEASVSEDGEYTSKEEVAEYIHLFGHLPSNFITKKDAKALGWEGGVNLGEVAPGMSIGGDRFGNYEKQLSDKKGRKYTECDIDYKGKKRNAKRIVFSNDGLIFYTEDHYKTFEQLY